MKKRYGLDSIVGKKSKLRFPRLIYIVTGETLNFLLPANNALSEPPFSTTLTMKKGDPLEVCDQFNDISSEYELGFPLKLTVTLSGTNIDVKVDSPTIFVLINIVFDITDYLIEKFRASKQKVNLSIVNMAIIQIFSDEDYFLSDIIAHSKSIYGSFMSYNSGRKKEKGTKVLVNKLRSKRFLKNIRMHINKQRYLYALKHFMRKTLKYKQQQQMPLLFDQIDYFYDILEDFEEAYDHYYFNQELKSKEYRLELILLAILFDIDYTRYTTNQQIASVIYQALSLVKNIFTNNLDNNRPDQDLFMAFNDNYYQRALSVSRTESSIISENT
jgi:ribosomal protein L11